MITGRGPGAPGVTSGVTSGVEFARERLAAGSPGDGAVDLGEIRRSEEIIDVLAERVAMPAPMLRDPAVTLLSALAADVDVSRPALACPARGPAQPGAARAPPPTDRCGRQPPGLAPGPGLPPRRPWPPGQQAPRASWRWGCVRDWLAAGRPAWRARPAIRGARPRLGPSPTTVEGAMIDTAKFAPPALTFDDVLLLPAHSAVMPGDADTTARLSRRITLNVPLRLVGHGYRDRGADGGGHGPPGRRGRAAPQPVRRGPGAAGRHGEAVRGRHDHQPGDLRSGCDRCRCGEPVRHGTAFPACR